MRVTPVVVAWILIHIVRRVRKANLICVYHANKFFLPYKQSERLSALGGRVFVNLGFTGLTYSLLVKLLSRIHTMLIVQRLDAKFPSSNVELVNVFY